MSSLSEYAFHDIFLRTLWWLSDAVGMVGIMAERFKLWLEGMASRPKVVNGPDGLLGDGIGCRLFHEKSLAEGTVQLLHTTKLGCGLKTFGP